MNDQERDERIVTHVTIQQGEPGQDSQPVSIPIVPDGVDGDRVYARPARPGETSDGVRLSGGQTLTVRLEASHVWVDGKPDPIRVVPDGREGNTVFVRPLRPSEPDTKELVRWIPGEEELVVTTHISHGGIHMTPDVGRADDLLTSVRLVPDGRDGSIVYARTLRPGEVDAGETVQVRPGDTVRIRAHNLVLSLDVIDRTAEFFDDGYKPLTNVLWTWIAIAGADVPAGARYLLAASRRLDASHRLLRLVREGLDELEREGMSAIRLRVAIYDTIGMVELLLVGLNRALRMAAAIGTEFGLIAAFPSLVTAKLPTIKALRDAYEHIEDRARGLVRGRPHPDALSVFEYKPLFQQRLVAYGGSSLDLGDEVTQLYIATREYLISAAAELSEKQGS